MWDEVERQSVAHGVDSGTATLRDVQGGVEGRAVDDLDRIELISDQIGVVCTIGDEVVGLDLVGAENVIQGPNAASSYSWTRPPSLSVLRSRARSGSPITPYLSPPSAEPAAQATDKGGGRCSG